MKKTASSTTLAGTTVTAFQGGLQVDAVKAGVEFDLHGAGFAPSDPDVATTQAKVCFTGQLCVRTPVAADGSFDQTFTLYGTGTYQVHIYQGVGADLPPMVYDGVLTVVE